jgi:hypothetical protein
MLAVEELSNRLEHPGAAEREPILLGGRGVVRSP